MGIKVNYNKKKYFQLFKILGFTIFDQKWFKKMFEKGKIKNTSIPIYDLQIHSLPSYNLHYAVW